MKNIPVIVILLMFQSCVGGSVSVMNNKCDPTSVSLSDSNHFDGKAIVSLKKAEVNVFLETSGSMSGYVANGKSQFQQVVFDYLSNIENSGLFSAMNLNYITDKVTFRGKDIDSFVNSLTSKGITKASGNRGTTDLAALMSMVMESADNNQISIFISDCIFSPGPVANPEVYLENQKIAIRNATKSYIDRNQFVGCTVYRFISDFDGVYYDYRNCGYRVSMHRPFYIWVFGSVSSIAAIKTMVPDDKFMGAKVIDTWTIFNGNLSVHNGLNDYGLLQPSPSNGLYKWISRYIVAKIRKSSEGFAFTFGVDLSIPVLLCGERYATDMTNYCQIVDKQTERMLKGKFRQDNVRASKYTHDITVLSDEPFDKGTICIAFDGKIPQWVYECSDVDDSVLGELNCSKTYGFKYMCEGIYAGFHSNNQNNITSSYDFEIK